MPRRLILVSNRGPVAYDRDESGRRVARQGGGGLVAALRGAMGREGVLWIASAIGEEDRAAAAGATADGVRLLVHDRRAYDLFYNVVANPVLWFVQHELWNPARPPAALARLEEGWQGGYAAVNEAFADAVCEELERDPSAIVFFQDYHLYLAPRLVRERFPEAVLAHFVHIPWVGPDRWRVLPESIVAAVHEGLLANDLVAFQTRRWLQQFTMAAAQILGVEREAVARRCVAHPVSVDTAAYARRARDPDVLERRRLLAAGRPERLVLRVERADPAKDTVGGLRAFARYLERHPEAHGRVGLLAVLEPCRLQIPEYAAYLEEIRETAGAIGRRFPGSVDVRTDGDFPTALAAYSGYDVLFVTPVRDGLNLVAKEGPLLNERDGVLVLSEAAGAADELGDSAVTVPPLDVGAQAEAIDRALTMPPTERRRRLERARRQVRTHDLAHWADSLLADLDRLLEPDPHDPGRRRVGVLEPGTGARR